MIPGGLEVKVADLQSVTILDIRLELIKVTSELSLVISETLILSSVTVSSV